MKKAIRVCKSLSDKNHTRTSISGFPDCQALAVCHSNLLSFFISFVFAYECHLATGRPQNPVASGVRSYPRTSQARKSFTSLRAFIAHGIQRQSSIRQLGTQQRTPFEDFTNLLLYWTGICHQRYRIFIYIMQKLGTATNCYGQGEGALTFSNKRTLIRCDVRRVRTI